MTSTLTLLDERDQQGAYGASVRQEVDAVKYIDMHAHMVSRTTGDYRQMALTGCLGCYRTGVLGRVTDRRSADVFADYFDHLTTFEPARAAEYGDSSTTAGSA